MRLFLTIIGCCTALVSLGQTTQQALRIQVTYEKAGYHVEQAVETIATTSAVEASAVVEYRAGNSITMLPGFRANRGSVFTANIKPVNIGKEGDAKLQLVAYPNPFEQSTTIGYYLPEDGKVNVWILDAQGKVVEKLVDSVNQSAGKHSLEWRPTAVSSGVYIPIVEANQQKATGRLVKK
ncbi:T9SS type A sorting domain-containing protein [Spirosoma sp.]|uniref:T9SS type A sorting domain-containing protein n=1 Tax=Spirosoma sp. TaxID=1899569 RepID=UPI003B3BC4B3